MGVDLFDSICKESKVAKKEKLKLEKAKPGLGWVGDLWGGGTLVLIILLDANRLYKVPF